MRARAARRREARGFSAEPPQGGVFGRLDDGRFWTVRFPTAEESRRFLSLLGPPPASEDRLQAALNAMGKGSIRHV